MTRNGKIARLPEDIRDQLNERLADGQPARKILAWLNSLDEVKDMLDDDFAGQPINAVNLTHWKQGGFRDRQNRQDICDSLARFAVEADDLTSPDPNLAEKLAQFLSAKLSFTARELLDAATDPQARWQCLRQLLPAFALLQIPPNCTQLQPIQEIVKRNSLSGAVGPGEIRPGAFPGLTAPSKVIHCLPPPLRCGMGELLR